MPAMDSSPIPFPSRKVCREYAARYAQFVTRCKNCFMQQTLAIGDMIDSLLTDYYVYISGLVLPPQRYIIENAYCAGLLYPVLQVEPHACFDRIADLANLETARLVSLITPDCRLPGPQRHRELTSRLYDAPLPAQAIAFAQIIVQAQEVVDYVKGTKKKKELRNHRDWLMAQMEVMAALRKVSEEEFFQTRWQRFYVELGTLVKKCDHTTQHERLKANVKANRERSRRQGA